MMVSKSDYTVNGRKHFNSRMGPYQQKPFGKHVGFGRTGKIGVQNDFSSDINVMFNASQIPDNPGYMDFSNPTPPIATTDQIPQNSDCNNKQTKPNTKYAQRSNFNTHAGASQPQRNLNWNQNQHRSGRGQEKIIKKNPMILPNAIPPGHGHRPHGHPRFGGPARGHFNPIMTMPRRPMHPPPHAINGPRGPIPPHIPPVGNVFKPLPPPMPTQRPPIHPGHNIVPPFMRRGGGGGIVPTPPVREILQRNQRNRLGQQRINGKPSISRANHIENVAKIPSQSIRKPFKPANKYMMRTLSEIGTQYHMDKPFVTDEIRIEYDKKVDIENRLKGNKDDKLFADFKKQRDKFVALYDAAREKYSLELKNQKAATSNNSCIGEKKDDKDQTKNMTAVTDIKKEAIQCNTNK